MGNKIFNKSKKNYGIKTIPFIEFVKIENLIKWITLYRAKKHDFKKYPYKIIKIDFLRCKFLKPYHITSLACLINEYQKIGFKVNLINIPVDISEYFKSFKFDQFCGFVNENNYQLPSDSKTFPLWRIEKTAIDLYPKYVQDYFEKLHFKGKSLISLSLVLAELMNNVFDHSESKIPGYTFTQYNTRNETITSCVCDFGVGIPKKVNNYLKNKNLQIIDNYEALLKAFELSFSTLSKPHNRGFGLDTIATLIKNMKSRLLIVSNNVVYNINNDGVIVHGKLNEYFPGTLVVIYLNAKELPLIEEELEDELLIL